MAGSQSPIDEPFLSVAIITKNEADRIGRCLRSLAIADEIVVVDSGSTDGTVRRALSAGARVVHHEWQGYAAQKQLAMEKTRGQWILSLDADEALSEELGTEILLATSNAPPDITAFSMPRMSRYLNRWIRHGGWYPDRKVRLVRRGMGSWVGDGVHERLEVEGRIGVLKRPLLHYVYRNITDQVKTINTFSTVTAEHRKRPKDGRYVILGLFHAIGKFLECAVWKLGVLDGVPGLVIAVNSSFYVFLKHAKAWEKGLAKDHPERDAPVKARTSIAGRRGIRRKVAPSNTD